MESWQILIAVAAFALVGVTVLLMRSHAVPRPAALARICGYAVSGVLALLGASPFVVIAPAMVGVAVAYVLIVRAHRADRGAASS